MHTTTKYKYGLVPVFRKGGIKVLGLCLEKLNHVFPLGDFSTRFQQLLGVSFQQFQYLQAPVQLPTLPLLCICIFKITGAKVLSDSSGSGCLERSGVPSPTTLPRTSPS